VFDKLHEEIDELKEAGRPPSRDKVITTPLRTNWATCCSCA